MKSIRSNLSTAKKTLTAVDAIYLNAFEYSRLIQQAGVTPTVIVDNFSPIGEMSRETTTLGSLATAMVNDMSCTLLQEALEALNDTWTEVDLLRNDYTAAMSREKNLRKLL